MQNLKNCKECGKLFLKVSREICPDCVEREEQDFLTIKQYLDEYPKSTVPQVAEETGVSEQKINRFIREGRLVTSQFENLSVECKRCGKEISEGSYCKSCQDDLQKGFESVSKDDKQGKNNDKDSDDSAIHIQDRLDKRR